MLHNVTNPQDMFVRLRTLKDNFWSEMASSVQFIREWANHLGVTMDTFELQARIWDNFLCRLSLDARYLTGRTPAESHGNEVLRLIVEVIENTLLSMVVIPQALPSFAPPPVPLPLNYDTNPVPSKELKAMQRSMHSIHLGGGGGGAVPIVLRRTKHNTNTSSKKKRREKDREKDRPSHKGSRSRTTRTRAKDSDNDNSDDDEEDDAEDNDKNSDDDDD
jgi:hypothetical protein